MDIDATTLNGGLVVANMRLDDLAVRCIHASALLGGVVCHETVAEV